MNLDIMELIAHLVVLLFLNLAFQDQVVVLLLGVVDALAGAGGFDLRWFGRKFFQFLDALG